MRLVETREVRSRCWVKAQKFDVADSRTQDQWSHVESSSDNLQRQGLEHHLCDAQKMCLLLSHRDVKLVTIRGKTTIAIAHHIWKSHEAALRMKDRFA